MAGGGEAAEGGGKAGATGPAPGGRADAGVPGGDEQVVKAPSRAPPDEGAAERFGQVARMDTGGRACRDVAAGAAAADGDAVVVGEPVQGLEGAADLAGDVVQGPVPGEVFPAEPGRVEVDHAGLLARGPGGWPGAG